MLRITMHDNQESLTFQLEGRLAGAWVKEVEQCQNRALSCRRRPVVRFDLTGVTFIDTVGQAFLASMHHQGAELVAADCMTKAIVAEITQASLPDCRPPRSEN